MEARMKNPAMVVPDAMPALQALGKTLSKAGVPESTLDLVYLRSSPINGCSVCGDMHAAAALKNGDTVERVIAVGAWRETPWFDDAERAALALAECLTRLNDRADAVPDDGLSNVMSEPRLDWRILPGWPNSGEAFDHSA